MSGREPVDEARLVHEIKVLIGKGDKAADKARQFYVAAGQHLKTLKAQHKGTWAEWEKILKVKIGIGKSRASELMQIADGRKTVEAVREETNQRKIQHRESSPFRNGETVLAVVDGAKPTNPAPDQVTAAVIALPISARDDIGLNSSGETDRLRARVDELENENRRLERENADLRRQLAVFKSPVRCAFVEDDGGRAAAGYGEETGDCVARAITIATGKPYGEVFEALKAAHARHVKGFRPGSYDAGLEKRRRSEPIHNGCDRKVYAPYLRSLGWQYTRTRERVCLRAGALPSGRVIVSLNGHLVALIDGVIHDTYDSGGVGRRPVEGYWSRAVKEPDDGLEDAIEQEIVGQAAPSAPAPTTATTVPADPWADLDIPDWLRRSAPSTKH